MKDLYETDVHEEKGRWGGRGLSRIDVERLSYVEYNKRTFYFYILSDF